MSHPITVHDKTFEIYLTQEEILKRIEQLAEVLNEKNHDKCPIFLVILNGAFLFASELIKRFEGACETEFVRISSYLGTGSSGQVKIGNVSGRGLSGREVIIIEDIIDSGRTLHEFLPVIHADNPASVQIVTLLHKPKALQYPLKVDLCGFEIPNDFVIGFGLDYDGLGRNLTSIYQLSE